MTNKQLSRFRHIQFLGPDTASSITERAQESLHVDGWMDLLTNLGWSSLEMESDFNRVLELMKK